YPQQVSLATNHPDTMFNRIDWLQIYQPVRTGAEKRLLLPGGETQMVVYQLPVQVDAARTGPNKIEAQTINVQSMRFYFNDRTMDFAKPVTIVVNKKTRF